MSPSDKIKAESNSSRGQVETDKFLKPCIMDTQTESSAASTSNAPASGTISSIPLTTASPSTLKCSINDQMKTFDPGEETGIERLTSNQCGNSVLSGRSSCSGLNKNNIKNYKAGSKINKLADMLAKRSQNVVEVTQSNASNLITDIALTSKTEETVTLNNISDLVSIEKSLDDPIHVSLENSGKSKELDLFRKSRRKSVPNQGCNLNQFQTRSNSKSCLDLSKLFLTKDDGKPEFNALGESLIKLQTDESTKRKTIRKNLKNVELTLILPEKKRRFSAQSENFISNKRNEKISGVSTKGDVSNENDIKSSQNSREIMIGSISSPVSSPFGKNLKKDTRTKQRKSKRLVETSTQTADIEFITVVKNKDEAETSIMEDDSKKSTPISEGETRAIASEPECRDQDKDSAKNSKPITKCQYCSRKLLSTDELKSHLTKKHPSKCVDCIKCNESSSAKEKSLSHRNEDQLNSKGGVESVASRGSAVEEIVTSEKKKEEDDGKQQSEIKFSKQDANRADLKIDVSFEGSKKSSTSPRNVQKISPKDTKTEEQLLEMEMLFYSHLSGNIQENLANHLDGKMNQNGCPVRTDKIVQPIDSSAAKTKGVTLLSAINSNPVGPDVQSSRAPSPYKTRSKTPNPLPPTAKKFKKLPNWQQKFWEKYNFPTNYRYEHRFWDKNYLNEEKSALYLKDLSCLDIKTQLIMRENIKKLENAKSAEEDQSKQVDNFKFPNYLSLVPRSGNEKVRFDSVQGTVSNPGTIPRGKKWNRKEREESRKSFKSDSDPSSSIKKQSEGVKVMMTRRQNAGDSMKEDSAEENVRRRKGSLDMSGGKKMKLRRQTSLDNIQKNKNCETERNYEFLDVNLKSINREGTPSPESAEISGEWVKPRSYLCGTCCDKFTNLWELEDHKWLSHPNVWCTHYEFEDEKIEKLFQLNDSETRGSNSSDFSNVKLTDLYKRYLLPHGFLKTAKLVPDIDFPERCTKCKKNCLNSSEMHKHMLDCGGDTNWFLTMYSSPMTIKRKWRPFGSRRRKQLGRKDVKRNIPNTPSLRSSYHYQHRIRTKPGDVETIQKMLANLPEKRARRAINFDEIKTRSQATIHSNRLLRKRFKSSFANNLLKFKNLKQRHQLKREKKEGNSKSTTDVSSDSTPAGSPKRRNKLKEANQMARAENTAATNTQGSSDRSKNSKKKKSGQKKESRSSSASTTTAAAAAAKPKNEVKKANNKRKIQEENIAKAEKPVTRRNNSLSVSSVEKFKRKATATNEKMADQRTTGEIKKEDEEWESCLFGSKEEKDIFKVGKKLKRQSDREDDDISGGKLNSVEILKSVGESENSRLGKIRESGKAKGKKEREKESVAEKKRERLNIQSSNAILRLRQNTREKTELVKRMKKKFQNSKRILEMKETKISDSGNRRSLRLKSLQGPDEAADTSVDFQSAMGNGEENDFFSKSLKIKKSILNLENCSMERREKRTQSGKGSKSSKNDRKAIGEATGETPDRVRRSSRASRKSFSQEESGETDSDKVFQSATDHFKMESAPGKNSRNFRGNSESNDGEEESPNKKSPFRSQDDEKLAGDKSDSVLICQKQQQQQQPSSPLTRTRSRFSLSKEKSEFSDSDVGNSYLEKSNPIKNFEDLEEMPILAKVEPIRGGKFNRKNEQKEIPILMPFVEKVKEGEEEEEPVVEEGRSRDLEEENCSLISFKVVKKKRKTSREIAPLKIVKKIENNFDLSNSRRSETGGRNDLHKSKKKIPAVPGKEMIPSEAKPAKATTGANRYFLGICPCEIDKGRSDGEKEKEEEGNEESGSDSEPLITLINQSQNKTSLSQSSTTGNENEFFKMADKEEEKKKSNSLEIDFHLTGKKKEEKVRSSSKSVSVLLEDFSKSEKSPEELSNNLFLPSEDPEVEKFESGGEFKRENKSKSKIRKKKKVSEKKPEERRDMETVTSGLESTDRTSGLKIKPDKIENVEKKSCSVVQSDSFKEDGEETTTKENLSLPERRSRRISKPERVKSTNEFVIDDPLILVDELWSDLDSDSDGSIKKKTKKSRKKSGKKKSFPDVKKTCQVNLEELLRNFGENKDVSSCRGNGKSPSSETGGSPEKSKTGFGGISDPDPTWKNSDLRKMLENRIVGKSYRRLSLKLFRFNKPKKNLGNGGERLSEAKKILKVGKQDRIEIGSRDQLPDLPFLVTEIKENPVQVIQCRSQKLKAARKGGSKTSMENSKSISEIDLQLKISLPLETIKNLAIFNNNHLTGIEVAEKEFHPAGGNPSPEVGERETIGSTEIRQEAETIEAIVGEIKGKGKRSEVIDKIFCCEICRTYYYSSSQLKIHKLSNRHKSKELEFHSPSLESRVESKPEVEVKSECGGDRSIEIDSPVGIPESKSSESGSGGGNDDEMPVLEGPFIENPAVGSPQKQQEDSQVPQQPQPLQQPPPSSSSSSSSDSFRFSQESLKDIQRAIGCTDEEMLILTLIGENTIEIENEILDLDPGDSNGSKNGTIPPERKIKTEEEDKSNGIFKFDLKQRMTSALACLVNKAVFNLLQKYESVAKSSVNPEAVSLLEKLSNLSRRKKILQLNDFLKKQQKDGGGGGGGVGGGESSGGNVQREGGERKDSGGIIYKYQCTICGSRFEKASTRECHISRSHRGKAKKFSTTEEMQLPADEWNDFWNYGGGDGSMGEESQFLCSDCGINFVSPQEVVEHQKSEHQAGVVEGERTRNWGPLQSSTIGSSDEILEGKKMKRRPKVFSTEELDQQRIIANNELRKLDRKFANKSKSNKIKWGMDALRFTVEKENKVVVVEEEEEEDEEEEKEGGCGGGIGERDPEGKPQIEIKNIDLIPKLNFSRTRNIPEFKVIQKNSLKNRFQKIIDNKLKRKSDRHFQQENETDEAETEVMLVPVVVKKKNKRQKSNRERGKKSPREKNVDVYDFNGSDSEEEPMVLSHIKKPMSIPTKLTLVKVKEGPSKNKADSTTKDLVPDDYDSEDSLPLSIVKKSKSGEEEEKTSEEGGEKTEGILEQVEYLIEQLENETGSAGERKTEGKKVARKMGDSSSRIEGSNPMEEKDEIKKKEEEDDSSPENLRISLASELFEFQDLSSRSGTSRMKSDEEEEEEEKEELEEKIIKEERKDMIMAEPESSQSNFDEEDSMPLVFMSKKDSNHGEGGKKCEETTTTDVSTTETEEVGLFEKRNENKMDVEAEPIRSSPASGSPSMAVENSFRQHFSMNENVTVKPIKPFENLNGNVIYCRNESMSDFDSSDFSQEDGLIDSNYEKINSKETDENLFEHDVTEKEPVVIICSKVEEEEEQQQQQQQGEDEEDEEKMAGVEENQKRPKSVQRKRKESGKERQAVEKKKKRFPLLTATIDENNFKRSENNFNSRKEVIVKKIWNRRKMAAEEGRNDDDFDEEEEENSFSSRETPVEIGLENEESQTEIEKEVIVNKIWSRKKIDHEAEIAVDKPDEKFDEDLRINKTEVSDEVVIKCGPKTIPSPKRRKCRSLPGESSKETIMRKIWSGKCTFQTKAALKTYESDVVPDTSKENPIGRERVKPKKRGRPSGCASTKRIKLEDEDDEEEDEVEEGKNEDEDDLDSLLEEIEREQLEKAIRLEFLQLRRSEKGNVEAITKDGLNSTVGLFAETTVKRSRKDSSERKRRKKMRRNLRHPRQSLLKRKKFMKKPIRRISLPEMKYLNEKSIQTNPEEEEVGEEEEDSSRDQIKNLMKADKTNGENFYNGETKVKSRRHKKHRHKHHHHKHRHKKSRHHKSTLSKRKNKHKSGEAEEEEVKEDGKDLGDSNADSFNILEKICQDIPNRIENEIENRIDKSNSSKSTEFMSAFLFEEESTKDCDEIEFSARKENLRNLPEDGGNAYEYAAEDRTEFLNG